MSLECANRSDCKLARTQERDKVNHSKLKDAEWRVLVIWECTVRAGDGLAETVRQFLDA